MSVQNKEDYIGKRVSFVKLLDEFPCSILILNDCNKEHIDIIDGIVVDIIPDNAENRSKINRLRCAGYEVMKTGGSGGYVHGELREKVLT
jgi:hypothetical protein